MTKPFIYAHFSSKGELLAEICSRGIASSLEVMDSVLPLKASPTEKLRVLGERFVKAVLTSQMHMQSSPAKRRTWRSPTSTASTTCAATSTAS